jgi:pre-mRNA-splicing factor CDC5/CEF1
MRDELGLNQGGNLELMLLSQKRRERAARAQLMDGLEGLPEPQYTYDLSVPDLPPEEEKEEVREEDAADQDARAAAKKRALEEAELERRSTAIKRDLPRPVNVVPEAFQVG